MHLLLSFFLCFKCFFLFTSLLVLCTSAFIYTIITRAALAWTKNNNKQRSLRNEKLKANSASETEEQRIERLRIGREKQ